MSNAWTHSLKALILGVSLAALTASAHAANDVDWNAPLASSPTTRALGSTAADSATGASQSKAVAMADKTSGVPTLVVTSRPLSEVLSPRNANKLSVSAGSPKTESGAGLGSLYNHPTQTASIETKQVLSPDYFDKQTTVASAKIKEIRSDLFKLQGKVADLSDQLNSIERKGQDLSANYYAAVATISTQLQSGTTPGNPRLVQRLSTAQQALESLNGNMTELNALALKISDAASEATFLQDSARAAYGLSGSVEEDHARLAQLEDSIANTTVLVERLLNNTNDGITRNSAYLNSERSNLRVLGLGITNGDLYGRSLANRPFLSASPSTIREDLSRGGDAQMSDPSASGVAPATAAALAPSNPRPLVTIKFDRPDVDYQQAVYQSMREAMERYPDARYELVAVSPGRGNPAKLAIENSKARRNAERVLRTMTDMGLASDKVDLTALTNDNIQTNEVHIYLR